MLKEHLQKHFNKIKTIQLKRHHYILGGLGIAAIIAIASIFGFQNIGTHAYEQRVICDITVNKKTIRVGDAGIAEVHCISAIGDLPSPSSLNANEIMDFDSGVLSLRMLETPVLGEEQGNNPKGTDEETYRIRYTGKTQGTSTINLKSNKILGENGYTQYMGEITVLERDTTDPNCQIDLNEIELIKGLSATGKVTCNDVKDVLYSTGIKFDRNVIEITKRGTGNEIENMEQQAATRGDNVIDYEITFKYKGIGSGKTTISISGSVAEALQINNVESDEIRVIEANCYRTRPTTGTYININKTGKAVFTCLNISGEIKEYNIVGYDSSKLNIIEFTGKEINSNTQIESERETTIPDRGNNIGTEYTITYEATGLGTTNFTINAPLLGINNVQSKNITVLKNPTCSLTLSKTGILVNETGNGTLVCENFTKKLFDTYISYGEEISINQRESDVDGTNSTATFEYVGIKTGTTTIVINETGKNAIGIPNNVIIIPTTITINEEEPAIITVSCDFQTELETVNQGDGGEIKLTCGIEELPDFHDIRDTMTIIENNGNNVIETGTSRKAGRQELNSTTYILTFTGSNTGNVSIFSNNSIALEYSGTKYKLSTKTAGHIEVEEAIAPGGPDCTIQGETPVNLNNTGEITIICLGTGKNKPYNADSIAATNAIDVSGNIEVLKDPIDETFTSEEGSWKLTLKYSFTGVEEGRSHLKVKTGVVTDDFGNYNEEAEGNQIYIGNNIISCKRGNVDTPIDEDTTGDVDLVCDSGAATPNEIKSLMDYKQNVLGIKDVTTPQEFSSVNGVQFKYTVIYSGLNEGTGTITISGTINNGNILTDEGHPTDEITVKGVTTPSKPIQCSIEANPDTVEVDGRGQIIVTCESNKLDDYLRATGLEYESYYVEVQEKALGTLVDGNYEYRFTYTGLNEIQNSTLNLREGVLSSDGGTTVNAPASYSTGITVNAPIPDCNPNWNNDYYITPEFRALNPTHAQIACALYGNNGEDETAYTMGWEDYKPGVTCSGFDEMNVVESTTLESTVLTENTIYVLTSTGFEMNDTIKLPKCSAIISNRTNGKDTTIGFNDIIDTDGDGIKINENYGILDNISLYNHNIDDNKDGINIQGSSNTLNMIKVYNRRMHGITINLGHYNKLNNIQVFGNKYLGIAIMNSSTKNIISNTQIYANDGIGIHIAYLTNENIIQNVEVYENKTGINVNYGNGNTFEDIELYYNDTNIYILSGLQNNGYGNLQQYPKQHFFENSGEYNESERGTTKWKSEISGFDRVYSESEQMTFYTFNCEGGWTTGYLYTGNNPLNITGEAQTKCDLENRGYYMGEYVQDTIWGEYEIKNVTSMLGNEHTYQGYTYPDYITNPRMNNTHYFVWTSNNRNAITEKIRDYSYGYKINTQKDVKLRNNNEGGYVNTKNFIGSNVQKYEIGGTVNKHTKVHYTIEGTATDTGEIKKYNIYQIPQNIPSTIDWYIGSTRTKHTLINRINQLTNIDINSGVEIYIETGDTSSYPVIVQMYGEGGTGPERNDYFAEHRYIGALNRQAPTFEIQPGNMCTKEEIINMTGTWNGYEYNITGFDFDDIIVNGSAEKVENSFSAGSTTGVYTWQISLRGGEGTVKVNGNTAEDILEFGNSQTATRTYNRDIYAPNISTDGFTIPECTRKLLDVDATDEGCAGISRYKLEGELGNIGRQSSRILRIDAETIGRTGGITKTGTLYVVDNFGNTGSRVITGTIININPEVFTGTSFDNPKVYGEITGPVSILNVINYLQAKEGECGTQDLKVVGVSCTNGTVGTVGNNNSVEITPSNNGETICSVTIEDNEHTTDTGYIKFTVKDLSSTEYSCSWTAPTPNQIKIAEEGQISLNCNGINFAELSAAEISSIKNQISASDETVLDYTISDTITINYEGNKTGETHFIFNGVALDGTRTLTSTNSNSIKVYIDIYNGCTRGDPTYDPIAVGAQAYIDLTCSGQQLHADSVQTIWSIMRYTYTGIIYTGDIELLPGSETIRFHYTGASQGDTQLQISGSAQGYLYQGIDWSDPIHVIANTPANGPTCSITGTEMVTLGQTGTITVICENQYGILTTGITNNELDYSGNIVVGNSTIENGTGQSKTFKFIFTGDIVGVSYLGLKTGAVKTVPGIENIYKSGNNITVLSGNNGIYTCQWKSPVPDLLARGGTGEMILDCGILNTIDYRDTLGSFLKQSGDAVTGTLNYVDGEQYFKVYYTGMEEGTTQFAISGTIGIVHIQTDPYRSNGITVINNGIELHINPQEKISNQNITVNMTGRNASRVKYYKTGTYNPNFFETCKDNGTDLNQNGTEFTGTETITNNEEGTTYIYLCGALGSDRSGMIIGTYKIDTTKPECEITANPREWTNSGVILSVTNINELNPYLYSWTGFNEGDMSTTTGTKTVYTTGTYSFYMKDAAGNTGICSTGVTNIDTQGPTGTVTYINGNGEYGNSCTTGSVTIKLNTGESISGYPEKAFARNSTGNSAWTGNNTKTVTENESGTGYIRDNAGNILPIPYNVTGIVNEGPSEPILNSPENGNPISSSNREFNWIGSTPDNCATINGYTMYILSGTDIVRSGNTGGTSIVPISLPNGTYSRYVVATDNFGQTAQSETRTFEIINDMPECTITYEPPYTPGFWTNQNVIGTLTCTDPNVNIITGTNVFTGNGYLPFSVQDSSNNIRIITGHVDWIDKIAPECGTWTYDPEMTEWTNSGVIATLTGSTDDLSGFGTGGGSCTISGYGLTCNVTISDKAGNPKVCTSSGATNIDTQDPIFNVIIVDGDNLYECQTGTAEITYVSGGVSGLPTNAYIWNGITGNSTTYSQYSSIVDTQNITVSIIDNAGNITETGITFNWQDVELQIGNTNQSLGQLTGEKVINNVITDLNVTAGACESIAISITGHSHATCTLNGNKLTITPQGNYNGNGYCTIAFTDGDTTKTGKYTFTVNTIVDALTLELDPAGSEWTGNSISVHMTATNTTGAKFLLTGESGITFDTCRNATNGGILVSESATPTIYEGTTTINTNGINYLYLCATSLTGQEEMISGIYKIDTEGFTGDVEYENVNGGIGNSCTTGNITIKLNTGESISLYPEKAFARNSTGNSAWTGNNTKTATENESGTGYIRDNAGHIIALPYNVTGIVNEEPTTPTLQNPGNGDMIPSSNTEFTWTESQPDNCATINGYTMYILSGTDIVRSGSTNGTGIIPISLPNGTYSRYVVVTDNFGQTAQSTQRTFEINNNMPECSITYEPPYTQGFWTNQNVTGTLTCTDTGVNIITGTNVFTGNGYLPFSVEDSSNNIRIITGHVTWIDKTPPYVSGHTNTTTGWYTGDLVYSFIYADTGAGISGEDTISCTISEEGTGQSCSITGVNICDKVGNCNNKPVVSQAINLDKSNPICGTRSYNPGSGTLTTGDVEATLTGSYDTISQIDISGGSCTVTGYNQNCNVTISDNAGNTEVCTSENVTWIDTGAPILHEVTPIGTTTDTTPDYTFSSTEPGIITYSGACSSATTGAVSGNNTITLNQLAYGTYSGCTITVTDSLGHTSDVLTISTFTIRQGGGGGGGGLHKDNCPDGDYSDSYYDGTCEGPKDICGVSKSKYDTELKTAYLYAYTHKMTTMCPIEDANLYGVIRRDELAKMLTEYALEVLDLEPEAGKSGCTAYNDIANSSAEMKYYMKTACELNIMGLESDGKTPMKSFYPAGLVSRAEFGTTLSRLIYGDAYNLESEAENTYPGAWYGKHLEALKRDEIMTKIYGDRPQHLELRGYVMLMIMRHGKARLDNVKNVPYSTKEEILEIYNKNKALTCEVSYYESADEHGTGMIYVKDNKLRENYKIYREGNASALIKNNKLYVRGDAIGTGMGMVVDTETTALEELEALLEDETYTFKNCNEAVKNINAFELPSNVKFKTLGDWFTELSDSFTNLFD